MRKRASRGFTLIELLVTLVLVAILFLAAAPLVMDYVKSMRNEWRVKAAQDNQAITSAMTLWARNNGGRLPAPYTGGGYTMTVQNPSPTTVAEISFNDALAGLELARNAINDDGSTARNVRVYQRVAGLTRAVPLYGRSGPAVTLTYDLGLVYLTECSFVGSSCNPNGATGRPGASPALTTTNLKTWTQVSPDVGARFASTLPAEMDMLATTARRIDRVRDALLSYYRGKQLAAAPTDSTNWYPGSSLAGKSPAGNQGCRDGWYALDSAQILPLIGLSREEFGVTAWGGRVEYCADYDPLSSKSPNAPPHAAALRFLASASSGSPPDPSVLSNNVLLTL